MKFWLLCRIEGNAPPLNSALFLNIKSAVEKADCFFVVMLIRQTAIHLSRMCGFEPPNSQETLKKIVLRAIHCLSLNSAR